MNKEELIKDLTNLLEQRNNIIGAINYVSGKIRELDRLEKLKKEKEEKQ